MCDETFDRGDTRRVYCSARCRSAAQRVRSSGGVVPTPVSPVVADVVPKMRLPGEPSAPVLSAVTSHLEMMGLMTSPMGAAAATLARRIDEAAQDGDAASSVASAVRELRMLISDLDASAVGTVADPVDELRAKRERRLSGA